MAILVSGGCGYIGSHTCVELLKEGHNVIVIDNLSNSKRQVLSRIKSITGKEVKFYEIDLLNKEDVEKVFLQNQISGVIHFAGFKAVGESVERPLKYYRNNIFSTINLCEIMEKHQVFNLVFSSSATVYGMDNISPLGEDLPLSATNPYGQTKLMIEQILKDLYGSDDRWNIALLRYFNPIGAHESGEIGEDPNDVPSNLMPYITQVAIGKRDYLSVFGNSYKTHDGTGVRDYIHVVDLARGHIKALEYLKKGPGLDIFNLGTGKGYSVLDVVEAFERANNIKIPLKITQPRKGDVDINFAKPDKADKILGWKAEYDLITMCKDSWKWQKNNPKGYE